LEIPTLIMLLVMAARWMRSEQRIARRTDRALAAGTMRSAAVPDARGHEDGDPA
jgi:hypothetical protein